MSLPDLASAARAVLDAEADSPERWAAVLSDLRAALDAPEPPCPTCRPGHTDLMVTPESIDSPEPAATKVEPVALPKRGDVGLPEATRDPIFLLERRRIHLGVNVPVDHKWNSDTERMETPELSGESAFTINEYAAAYPDNVVEVWLPESLWFTREEAEAFRASHAYRWPQGSRVYCLCAEGELAALLKARTAYLGATVPDLYQYPAPAPSAWCNGGAR